MTQPLSAIDRDWSHQPALAQAVRQKMREGARRIVAVLPTGTGKTRTAGEHICVPAVAKGSRVVWLAHRRELVGQACATLAKLGLDVGAVAASAAWPARPEAPVQVCSIQTLLAREATVRADLAIADECHHFGEGADEWRSVLDPYPRVVGLTATPERGDGGGLAPMFDAIVVGITVRQATTRGILVPCEVVRPDRMLRRGAIAQDPIDAYMAHAMGTQAILFARSVSEAESYAATFNARGVRAAVIEANTPKAEREASLEAFRQGAVRVLCNVYVLTEGTDLPMAETCILARGASSAGIYIQMVGRVLRSAPGKQRAILLDLRGVSHLHGPPEDERVFSLEGRGITKASAEVMCPVCGAIREPGQGCAACGWEPDERDAEATRVTNDPLVKFARKIAEGPQQRHETLVRWIARCLDDNKNPKSVFYKWKHVYQERLTTAAYSRALWEVNARRSET